MLLVQLGMNSTRDVWKFCQNWTSRRGVLVYNLETRACNPLWRLAEALGNTSESRALIGCFQVLIIIQTVGLFSDSNIV
jgi:hypothetical protein